MIAMAVDPVLQALATSTVRGALLFTIIAPIVWLLRKHSPQLREALWTIALIGIALPPSLGLTSGWSPLSGLREVPAAAVVISIAENTRASLDASFPATRLMILAIWMSGMVVVAAALLRSRRVLRRVARAGRAVDEPRVLRLFERAKTRLAIGRRVDLVTGDSDVGAFTIGTVRPLVFLPTEMLSLPEESIECVLAHELAHVRRLDDLDRQLQTLVQSVHFFNPVVWIVGALRGRESELASDCIAITQGRLDPSTYGRGMIDVLRLDAGYAAHAPMFIGRRRAMSRRLESIFQAKPLNRAVTTAVIALGVLLIPMSGEEPRRVEGDVVAPVAIQKVQPVYPPEAKAAGIEGSSIVVAIIDVDGNVIDAKNETSTREDFAAAALEAVRQWKFKPATLEGKPITVKYTLTFRYRLDHKRE